MKAQAAIEYLMTYGWAVLVIIIVSAALYSLGVFSPGTWTQKSARGFSSFIVDDWSVTTSTLTMRIGSRVGNIVNVTGFSSNVISGGTGSCSASLTSEIAPGDYGIISGSCSNIPSSGTSVKMNVSITYDDRVSGISHTDFGTLEGKVE